MKGRIVAPAPEPDQVPSASRGVLLLLLSVLFFALVFLPIFAS